MPTLNQNDLQTGDILLHRSMQQKPHQHAISRATGSPYTHASIYLGNGMIAEATIPVGVRKIELSTQLQGDYCVGVLRNQLGFGQDRTDKLLNFVESVVVLGAAYDIVGALAYPSRRKEYLSDQLAEIERSFGAFIGEDELLKECFFCSAFVVACYYVVGIIDESAQVAYPYKLISPADLHGDPTFGWFLGYMLPRGATVPATDPLRGLTSWDAVGF